MKRVLSVLLIVSLLVGCGPKGAAPSAEPKTITKIEVTPSPVPSATAHDEATAVPTPSTTATRSALPTFAPQVSGEALFPEDLLSADGDPVLTLIHGLLTNGGSSKKAFLSEFN